MTKISLSFLLFNFILFKLSVFCQTMMYSQKGAVTSYKSISYTNYSLHYSFNNNIVLYYDLNHTELLFLLNQVKVKTSKSLLLTTLFERLL